METKEQTTEIIPVEPLDEQIKQEVVRFNLPDARIAQLKQAYGGLTIAGVDDKEGYEAVRKALSEVKSIRTGIDKKRKDLKEGYLKIGKAIDDEAKRLTALVTPLEEQLAKEKQRIDEEKESAKRQREMEEQAKLNQRINDLIANGMAFDGTCYVIGDTISVDVVTVRTMPDDKYEALMARVKIEHQRIEQEKAEQSERQRKEKEEFERQQLELKQQQEQLQKQKEEFERQQQELKKQAEEAERLKNELEEKKRKAEEEERLAKEREQEERRKQAEAAAKKSIAEAFESIGMKYNYAGDFFEFKNDFCEIQLSMNTALEYDVAALDSMVRDFSEKIQQAKKDQDAKDEKERQERLRKEAEEEERKAAERKAQMSDLEKLKEYTAALKSVPSPEPFTSAEMATRYAQFKNTFGAIINALIIE